MEGENNEFLMWRGVFPVLPITDGEGKGIRISLARGEEEPTLARRWLIPVRDGISLGKEVENSEVESVAIGLVSLNGSVKVLG